MQDNVFIDTNVLIYLYSNEKHKQKIAKGIFENYDNIFISSHVLSVFSNLLFRKFKCTIEDVQSGLNDIYKYSEVISVTIDTIKTRLKICGKNKY